jgi:hypothetical protein
MDIPRNQLRKYSWEIFRVNMEKFRPILGKIPRNFSMLTPRIYCFTGDGSSEELTKEKFLGNFPTYSRKKTDISLENSLGKNPIKCRNYSMGKIPSTFYVSS